MATYDNTIDSARFLGAVRVSASSAGGDGNLVVDDRLYVTKGSTLNGTTTLQRLAPFPVTSVNTTTVLPDTLGCESFVLCGDNATSYTVGLPSVLNGLTFWIVNLNSVSTTTIIAAVPIYFEQPVGTWTTANTLVLEEKTFVQIYSDGSSWTVLLNTGIYSVLASQIGVLDHFTYDGNTNTVTCDASMSIAGSLQVASTTTMIGDLIANSAHISPIELSYLDGVTSNIQAQFNAMFATEFIYITDSTLPAFSNGTLVLLTSSSTHTLTLTNQSSVANFVVLNTGTADWNINGSTLVFITSAGVVTTASTMVVKAGRSVAGLAVSSGNWVFWEGTSNYGFLGAANTWSGVQTFLGNLIANSQTVTPANLGNLSGVTSNIQTQINALIPSYTNYTTDTTLPTIPNGSFITLTSSTPRTLTLPNQATVVNFVFYNTGSANWTITGTALYYTDNSGTFSVGTSFTLPSARSIGGVCGGGGNWFIWAKTDNYGFLAAANTWTALQTLTNGLTVSGGTSNLQGNVTLGTSTSNTTTVNSNISANSQIVSPTNLGYLSGATSNIQTQLNSLKPTYAIYSSSATIVLSSTTNGSLIQMQNSSSPQTLTLQALSALTTTALTFWNTGSQSWTISSSANIYYTGTDGVLVGPVSSLSFPSGAFANGIYNVTNVDWVFSEISLNYGWLGKANTWTGQQTFSGNIIANSQTVSPTNLGYLSGATSNIQNQISSLKPAYTSIGSSATISSATTEGTFLQLQASSPQTLTLQSLTTSGVNIIFWNAGPATWTISSGSANIYYVDTSGSTANVSSFSFPLGTMLGFWTGSLWIFSLRSINFALLGAANTWSALQTLSNGLTVSSGTISFPLRSLNPEVAAFGYAAFTNAVTTYTLTASSNDFSSYTRVSAGVLQLTTTIPVGNYQQVSIANIRNTFGYQISSSCTTAGGGNMRIDIFMSDSSNLPVDNGFSVIWF